MVGDLQTADSMHFIEDVCIFIQILLNMSSELSIWCYYGDATMVIYDVR